MHKRRKETKLSCYLVSWFLNSKPNWFNCIFYRTILKILDLWLKIDVYFWLSFREKYIIWLPMRWLWPNGVESKRLNVLIRPSTMTTAHTILFKLEMNHTKQNVKSISTRSVCTKHENKYDRQSQTTFELQPHDFEQKQIVCVGV